MTQEGTVFSPQIPDLSLSCIIYRKIPKIRPCKYKPLGGFYLENCPQWYKVKQGKNGKFTSNYKAGPIDFETQISLRR